MKIPLMSMGGGLIFVLFSLFPPSGESAIVKPRSPALQIRDPFPQISFQNLFTPEDRKYLGVGEKKTISFDDVRADVLVIYVFNTYCPICVKSVPVIKEVFEMIDLEPQLVKRIKIIGIGAGDMPMELKAFKEGNVIPFPVIPDTDYKGHKALQEPAVPFIVVAKHDRKRRWVVAAIHSGVNFAAESFVSELKELLDRPKR